MASTQLGIFFLKSNMHILNAWEPTLTSWSAGYWYSMAYLTWLKQIFFFFFHFFKAIVFAHTRIEHILFYEKIKPNA